MLNMNLSDDVIQIYRPRKSWLAHESRIHGIGHLSRVFVLQELISDKLEANGVNINRTALRWAAICHDVGRVDDGLDLDHGRASAEWMSSNLNERMTPEDLDVATYAVHWHVPEDSEAPVMTPELMILKDADGLDRVRLGDLDASYLRTDAAKRLVDFAENLYTESLQGLDFDQNKMFEQVIEIARHINL